MGASALRPLGHDPRVAERCENLLSQFHLLEVMDQPTQQLAYGKRRLLEMAIALACEPSVLLLDEPVAGVPAGEREELLRTVAALPADVSVLLIEHDMDLVFSFANSMTVMVNGAVLTEGTPAEMAADAVGDVWRRRRHLFEMFLGLARLPEQKRIRFVDFNPSGTVQKVCGSWRCARVSRLR
jgi:ABC-type branched-subunit amino acid transport system ATPase component